MSEAVNEIGGTHFCDCASEGIIVDLTHVLTVEHVLLSSPHGFHWIFQWILISISPLDILVSRQGPSSMSYGVPGIIAAAEL